MCFDVCFFFFFSSRRRHTRYWRDWSSDVCSSDLKRCRPTPKWNIEADVDWTDWDSFKTLTLTGTSALFGVDLPLPLNWHASMFYEFGVTRYLDNGWYVSAGYFFSGETARDKYWNPGIPDTD